MSALRYSPRRCLSLVFYYVLSVVQINFYFFGAQCKIGSSSKSKAKASIRIAAYPQFFGKYKGSFG